MYVSAGLVEDAVKIPAGVRCEGGEGWSRVADEAKTQGCKMKLVAVGAHIAVSVRARVG